MRMPLRNIYSGTIQLPHMHIAKVVFHSMFHLYLDNRTCCWKDNRQGNGYGTILTDSVLGTMYILED